MSWIEVLEKLFDRGVREVRFDEIEMELVTYKRFPANVGIEDRENRVDGRSISFFVFDDGMINVYGLAKVGTYVEIARLGNGYAVKIGDNPTKRLGSIEDVERALSEYGVDRDVGKALDRLDRVKESVRKLYGALIELLPLKALIASGFSINDGLGRNRCYLVTEGVKLDLVCWGTSIAVCELPRDVEVGGPVLYIELDDRLMLRFNYLPVRAELVLYRKERGSTYASIEIFFDRDIDSDVKTVEEAWSILFGDRIAPSIPKEIDEMRSYKDALLNCFNKLLRYLALITYLP